MFQAALILIGLAMLCVGLYLIRIETKGGVPPQATLVAAPVAIAIGGLAFIALALGVL